MRLETVSRVPFPEIYSSISEASRIAYADKTEAPSAEAVSRLGGVEVDWLRSFPAPGIWEVQAGIRANRSVVVSPELETTSATRYNFP